MIPVHSEDTCKIHPLQTHLDGAIHKQVRNTVSKPQTKRQALEQMYCEETPSDNSELRNKWVEMDYEKEAEDIGVSKMQSLENLGSNEC